MKTLFYAALMASLPAAAQQTSGVIEYEVTSRVEAGQFKVVRMGPGGSAAPADMPMPDIPDIMTTKQTLTFSAGKGKLETEAFGGQMMTISSSRTEPAVSLSASTVPTFSSGGVPPGMKTTTLRPPLSNTTYIDLANRKYLTVTEEKEDSVVKGAWYSEEDYKTPAAIKTSGKTKTIAGYNCKRATVKMGEESFVVWYTEEIPVLFSPINGVLPEKGVVLSIESSKRSYIAKKVTLKPVREAEVSPPANAEKVTAEQLKEKRRQILEKFHNDRLEKLQ